MPALWKHEVPPPTLVFSIAMDLFHKQDSFPLHQAAVRYGELGVYDNRHTIVCLRPHGMGQDSQRNHFL